MLDSVYDTTLFKLLLNRDLRKNAKILPFTCIRDVITDVITWRY